MKKVIFLVTTLNSGGIENYLLRFLNFFDGQIEPIIICKGNVFGELEEEYQKIKHIQLIKMDVGFFNLNSYLKLYSFFKRSKVNSVCDFTGNFAGLILLSANFAGINNRISFYRGSTNHFSETKGRMIYNHLMLQLVKRYACKILSNSKSALDYFYSDRDLTKSTIFFLMLLSLTLLYDFIILISSLSFPLILCSKPTELSLRDVEALQRFRVPHLSCRVQAALTHRSRLI